jgi:hypothetical protein
MLYVVHLARDVSRAFFKSEKRLDLLLVEYRFHVSVTKASQKYVGQKYAQ